MKWTSCLRVHGTAVTPRRPWDQANAAIHYPLTFFHPIRPEDCNANSIQGCTERRRDGGGVEKKSFFFFFLITHLSLRPLQPQWKKKRKKKTHALFIIKIRQDNLPWHTWRASRTRLMFLVKCFRCLCTSHSLIIIVRCGFSTCQICI